MKKRIIFPSTNRAHSARQQLLLDELKKDFEVDIWQPTTKSRPLSVFSIFCAVEFNNYLAKHDNKFDGVLVRGDRMELLPITVLCAYKQIPIIHIEGGAESGAVIDSKIRHSITQLSDIHFVTDEIARKKVLYLGANPDKVFNVGSLDVSYAKSIKPRQIIKGDYILLLHHSIPDEETVLVYDAIKNLGYKIVGIKSNQDYEKSIMREEYSAEDFISLMNFAKCFVSNSSAACKEASILGVPTSLTGKRQDGRIVGRNVIRVPHDKFEIEKTTKYQIEHGRYEPDYIYFRENTEKLISNEIKNFLYDNKKL